MFVDKIFDIHSKELSCEGYQSKFDEDEVADGVRTGER